MNLKPLALALSAATALSAQAEEGVLEEVIVTAEFRPVALLDTAASVSVFDEQAIEDRAAVVGVEAIDAIAIEIAAPSNPASGAS